MTESTKKKITVYLDEELHRPARVKIADLDTSFTAVMQQLLRDWTFSDAKAPAPPAAGPGQVGQHKEAHELLEFILENDRQAADWINGNLKMFAEAIHARQGVRPKRKAG